MSAVVSILGGRENGKDMNTSIPIELTPRHIGPVWIRLHFVHGDDRPPVLPILKHHREALKRDAYFARLRGRTADKTAPRYLVAVAKRERKARG